MLRANLSTRPFYNERAVHLALGAAAAVVLLLTIVSIVRIATLSGRTSELQAQIKEDEQAAVRAEADAKALRSRINEAELATVVAGAREANALIDQRTFSWTEFFNLIEATLPPDVMLSSVSPAIKDGQTEVTMEVFARRAEDIDAFMESLEATKAFAGILPKTERLTDEGLHEAQLVGRYVTPPGGEAR
jgi:Tfp pilus assembly protein PilN